MNKISFELSKPPSINHIYGFTSRGGFARSYITKKGKEWFEEASYLVPKEETITEKISVGIKLYTAYRQDCDNIVKPVLDLLQKTNLIENDSQVYKLGVEKFSTTRDSEKVIVSVESY